MAYEPKSARTYVAADASELVGIRTVAALGVKEMTVRWSRSYDEFTQAAIEFLTDFTWSSNKTKKRWIRNPKVARHIREGVWRQVTARMAEEGEDAGIYLILRLDLHTTLDDKYVRTRNARGDPDLKTLSFTRYYRDIHPDNLVALVNTRKATLTYTNPVIGRKADGSEITQTGTFIASATTGVIRDDDGSGVVSEVLTQVSNVTSIADLGALNKRLTYDNEILALFGFQEGEGDALGILFPNINPTAANRKECCITLTDTELVTQFKELPNTTGTFGWSYLGRRWRRTEDNTAQFILAFKKATWEKVWDDDQRVMSISDPEGLNRGKRLECRGLDKAQAESDFEELVAETGTAWDTDVTWYDYGDMVTESGKNYLCIVPHEPGTFSTDLTDGYWIEGEYVLASKGIHYAGGGQYSLTALERPAYAGTAEADAHVDTVRAAVGNHSAGATRTWFRRTATAKDTLITATTGNAVIDFTYESVTYTHLTRTVTNHRDGSYTVRQTGFVAKARGTGIDLLTTGEKVVSAEWGSYRTEGYEPKLSNYRKRIKIVYGRLFTGATAAWTWAYTNSKDSVTNIYDENGVERAFSYIEPQADGRYAGFRVQFHNTFRGTSQSD